MTDSGTTPRPRKTAVKPALPVFEQEPAEQEPAEQEPAPVLVPAEAATDSGPVASATQPCGESPSPGSPGHAALVAQIGAEAGPKVIWSGQVGVFADAEDVGGIVVVAKGDDGITHEKRWSSTMVKMFTGGGMMARLPMFKGLFRGVE